MAHLFVESIPLALCVIVISHNKLINGHILQTSHTGYQLSTFTPYQILNYYILKN